MITQLSLLKTERILVEIIAERDSIIESLVSQVEELNLQISTLKKVKEAAIQCKNQE